MTVRAVDLDVTDTVGAPKRRQPRKPEYASTSSTELIYPSSAGVEKARMMVLSVVHGPTRNFLLKRSFALKLEHSVNAVLARHESLPVSGQGENTREAIQEFCEMFELQWEALVDCAPDQLTEDAFRAREEFLALAEPVEG